MEAREFVVGSRVAVWGRFRVAGVLTDPTTVRCYVKQPGVPAVVHEFPVADMTKEEIGAYRFEFTLSEEGPWGVRWEGSGALEAVDELLIQCVPSAVV